jgi:hypothetical protein
MSLWIMLLALLLAVTAVIFFVLGKSATEASVKRQRYTVAALALTGTVAIVVAGTMRGRRGNKGGYMEEPYVNDMDFDDFGAAENVGPEAAALA